MKKILTLGIISSIIMLQCSVNNAKHHITSSNSIAEINEYIKTAHPDDQYLTFLKKRLVTLKNQSWMKSDFGPAMSARALHPTFDPKKPIYSFNQSLYEKLLQENKDKQLGYSIDLINDVVNGADLQDKNVIIIFQNKSSCNLILNIRGLTKKDIAVPSKSNMYFTLDKGEYDFSCNVCDKIYASKKSVSKNMILTIGA